MTTLFHSFVFFSFFVLLSTVDARLPRTSPEDEPQKPYDLIDVLYFNFEILLRTEKSSDSGPGSAMNIEVDPAPPSPCLFDPATPSPMSLVLASITACYPPKVFVPPHPLIKHWVSVLRNEQTPSPIFKNAMSELGRLLMYEASRDWLHTVSGEIQTPMDVAQVEFIDPREPVAVIPILRVGLALAEHAA